MSVKAYSEKADDLLWQAVRTTDLRMRSAVLEQALMWHHRAVQAHTNRSERTDSDADEGGRPTD